MKIAVMMRAMDQDSGFRVYVERLVEAMIHNGNENQYLLIYKTPKWFGRFSDYKNVKEVLAPAPHKLLWDQVVVPYKAWREGADIIFNPKFSVPLISPCPVTMGLQEPAWWAWPEHHTWLDVRYMRAMLPLYCRKSDRLFPMSQFILDENRKYLRLPLEKASVTFTSYNQHFRYVDDSKAIGDFLKKYALPEKFILSVTRVENLGNSSSAFSGTKNVETTIRAYAAIREKIPHKLVIVGKSVREYLIHTGWKESELEGIHFTGFIAHDEMPLLYNAADLFVIPSFYEGFGHTLVEAMACGCPIVASQTGSCPEVTAGAAALADPHDYSDFANKMLMTLTDALLRNHLRDMGFKRASFFSWERTAALILEGLSQVVQETQPGLISTAGTASFQVRPEDEKDMFVSSRSKDSG